MSEQDALNVSNALERLEGDSELLIELMRVFVEEADDMLRAVKSAFSSKDAYQLERSAHSLKGAVSNLSADRAFELAYAIEVCGREGRVDESAAYVTDLEHEMRRAVDEAETLIATGLKE